MPPATGNPASPRPFVVEESPALAVRIRQLRGRHGRVALATGLAMMVAALAVWLVGETVTDFLVNLPWVTRLVVLLLGVGGALGLWFVFGIRVWRKRLEDETVALMVERSLPAFRSRFIAAVQLAGAREEGVSPTLVKALVAETTAMAATMDFSRVVETRGLWRWLKIAALAVFISMALGVGGGSKTWPLVRRALLSHQLVPRKTILREISAPRVIAVGDEWKVVTVVGGIVPAGGKLIIKTVSGRRQEYDLVPGGGQPATFARTLQTVQESFDYHVVLGDAESDSERVRVQPRPGVAGVECRQVFPTYTRLPARRRALGDLKILAGSRLALKVRAKGNVKAGEIRLLGADRAAILNQVPLVLDRKDHSQLTGEIEIPAKGAKGLTLHLVDEDGIESRDGAIYPLELVADEPPAIRITWPERREELLTREATMLIAFNARDDYGVAKVRLNYAVDWVEGAPHQTIELGIGNDLPKDLTRRFHWRIGRIMPHVEEGSVIDYWFEVLDANDVTGPGIGTTEHLQARIVSEAEKRADLANRLSDAMEGLNGVKQGEEDLNQRLGEIIFEKPPEKP